MHHTKTKKVMVLSFIIGSLVKLIARMLFKIRVKGEVTVPSKGGALIVANHTSYIDFILMVASCPRPVHFVMNEDVFKKPLLRPILKALHCIPVGPRAGKNNFDAFNNAVKDLIDAGKVVAIFAEGTVSRTGQLLEFKKGVEHLSRIINGPIIPVHFDNVVGTPFTYEAGKRKITPLRLKTIGRLILVRFGKPIYGEVKSFHLRQRIKELEAENFQERVRRMGTIQRRISESLSEKSNGFWSWGSVNLLYRDIPEHLSILNKVLLDTLRSEQRVAVLLPHGKWNHLIYLWLLSQHKTAVPIDPEWTNEERLHVMNKSNTRLLLTTKDLNFTKYAPTSEGLLYIEDILTDIVKGRKSVMMCDTLKWAKRKVRTTWAGVKKEEPSVIFFERSTRQGMRMVPMHGEQLVAVTTSMKQVYDFKPEVVMSARLQLDHSFGYVLQLVLPLLYDISVDVRERSTTEDFIEQLMQTKPEIVVVSPAQLEFLASASKHRNFPFLTHVFTADVHPACNAVQALTSRGIAVMTCAGMNATASVFAVNLHNYKGKDIVGKDLIQEAYDDDSIGKALPGVAVRVTKPNDYSVEMDCNEVGEIWIKGASVCAMFCDEEAIEIGEWYRTGWMGYIDQKGFIHLESTQKHQSLLAC